MQELPETDGFPWVPSAKYPWFASRFPGDVLGRWKIDAMGWEDMKHEPNTCKVPRLSADIARCPGVGNDIEGWREGCDSCLRRISPPVGERQVWMAPPAIIVFECEYLLEGP